MNIHVLKYLVYNPQKILIPLLSILLVNFAKANSSKYWIIFKDKKTTNYNFYEHLSEKAIKNRKLLNIPLNQYSDIPVNEEYVNQLKKDGIKIIHASKWLNAVSAEINILQLEKIHTYSFVEKVVPLEKNLMVARHSDNANASYSTAISQLEPDIIKEKGLTGQGVTIGVIDVGFYGANINPFLKGVFDNENVLGVLDLINPEKEDHFNDRETFSDDHGNTVLQMIAGKYSKQKQVGFATKSKFYLARTDHGTNESRIEEDNWVRAIEWMDSLGVRLVNTSLGYATGFDDPNENYKPSQMNGNTSMITKAAQIASDEKGMLIIVSAGNEGDEDNWKIITAPADAKGVLSVGATTDRTFKADYSSIGPENLSYLKPNVSAFSLTGTSFSAPLVCGYAACLIEYKPTATNAEVFEAIQKSANLYPYGNNYVGYGVPKASIALDLLDGVKHSSKVVKKEDKGKGFMIIKVKNKLASHGIYFHKKNATIVYEQGYLKGDKGKFKIIKPENINRSTIILGKEIFEIFWQKVN